MVPDLEAWSTLAVSGLSAREPLPTWCATSRIVGGAGRYRGLRIGLLGGSFNPAHAGHRHMSLIALRRLRLDQLWWLVSPQNPLKSRQEMAPVEMRRASARNMTRHPRLRVSDIESRLGTQFTADTLMALRQQCPKTQFVWVMGADNMVHFHHWRAWNVIVTLLPIAIIDRPSYSIGGLSAKMPRRYRASRLAERAARRLAGSRPPSWVFLTGPRHHASATQIRAKRRRLQS